MRALTLTKAHMYTYTFEYWIDMSQDLRITTCVLLSISMSPTY